MFCAEKVRPEQCFLFAIGVLGCDEIVFEDRQRLERNHVVSEKCVSSHGGTSLRRHNAGINAIRPSGLAGKDAI
jgi:hypothetical protein